MRYNPLMLACDDVSVKLDVPAALSAKCYQEMLYKPTPVSVFALTEDVNILNYIAHFNMPPSG